MTDLGYGLAAWLARRLPPRAADPLTHLLSDLYVFTHPRRARAVRRNLAWIWEETGRGGPAPRARETYRAFARAVRDFLAQEPGRSADARIRLTDHSREALEAARRSGRGTILVSGHFGPWERALQWVASELGGVQALAAPHRSAKVERFFVERRARGGVRTLCTSRPAQAAIGILKSGGWIAALVDRPRCPARAPKETGIVPIDRGPLLLARRAGSLVLPGVSRFCRDGGLEIDFDPPFSLERAGGLDVAQGRARVQCFFDGYVRAHPTQWFEWRPARSFSSAAP